jgi:hypothetical protein
LHLPMILLMLVGYVIYVRIHHLAFTIICQ